MTPVGGLVDLGGVAVRWEGGTLVQDPGTNRYGPGDVFRAALSGDVYQLDERGQLRLVHNAHAELHRELARNTARLARMGIALFVAVAVETALTLFDVWLKLGGRWPWQ